MAYLPGTITVSNITDNSATITVELNDVVLNDYPVGFSLSATGQTTTNPAVTVPANSTTGTTEITGLASSTEYTLQANSGMSPGPRTQAFTTKATGYNDPRTATQEQWEDLINKIKNIEGRILNGGTTAPTTSTVGSVGTQYNCVNNGTPEIYICTDTTGGTYTWAKIN